MTQLTTFDELFKHAFGFDRIFNEMNRSARAVSTGFPPYNVITDNMKEPSTYVVELAVAGFAREELAVSVIEDAGARTLLITGAKKESADQDSPNYVVKMLAARDFMRQFTLSDEAEVTDVEHKDGILRITVKVKRTVEKPIVRQLTIS